MASNFQEMTSSLDQNLDNIRNKMHRFNFYAGRTHAEIMKSLRFPGSRRKFVYRTIRRYKATPQLKKVVRERIRRNPRRSMRKMALDLKISDFSIRKVVRTDLGMRSYKRKKVPFLSRPVKEKRLR